MMNDWRDSDGAGVKVFVLDTAPEGPIPWVEPEQTRRFVRRGRPGLTSHAGRVARVIAARHPVHPGFAPACRLHMAGVIDPASRRGAAVVEALRWAIDEGADVVNMSFVSPRLPDEARDLLERLDERGTICVASHNRRLPHPHRWPCIISAGHEGRPNVRTEASSEVPGLRGPERFRGTSCSAAIVSGVAACVKALESAVGRSEFLAELACPPPVVEV